MVWFEVFIPAKDQSKTNVTLTIEAPNWIGALRSGLSNIGEGQDAMSNVMCDIKPDNSIHVTNPNTKRVFRLREVPAPSDTAPPAAAAPAPVQAAPPQAATEPMVPPIRAAPHVSPTAATVPSGTPRPAPTPTPKRKAPPPSREVQQFSDAPRPATREESPVKKTDPQIGRTDLGEVNIDDVIADVFDATQDLQMEATIDPKRVAEVCLDLAMQKVPAESGTFYTADINNNVLAFTAVRGPKADAILKKGLSVPVGQGIVGFCAQEGVCLVIDQMKHDQRYFSAIADAVGYQPDNTLCATCEADGRLYGAIQLINAKRGGFTAAEMEIVRYIGLTAAGMLSRAADQRAE